MDPRKLIASEEATADPRAPLSGAARLAAVYEIGRQLLEQSDPQRVMATIHERIVAHLDPEHACLLALEGETLRPVRTHGLDLTGPVDAWALSRTVLARARESGLGILATDVRRDARFDEAGSIQKLGIRSVMCVPLGHAPVRGLVYVDRRGDTRPFAREDLEFLTAVSAYAALVLERALEHQRTADELRRAGEQLETLREELLRHEIVGRSDALVKAYATLTRLARMSARVLLCGETGTGKELFARAYARNSPRAGGAYMPVPIPALAPSLAESELFGHVRGAFTEAARDKKGRLELAHGGVLFLDEIGDVEPSLQPKLLRFLDSGELFRVGDNERRQIDALVVSATNRNLERDCASGRFRGDLLARLGHVVAIPPLRERREDIPLLVEHFLRVYARASRPASFSSEALALLQRHHWPFNVRELQQVVERACCLVDREVVLPEDLPEYLREPRAAAGGFADVGPLKNVVDAAEREHIARVLEFTKGNRRRAIEILKIAPETFYKRLEEFGLGRRGED